MNYCPLKIKNKIIICWSRIVSVITYLLIVVFNPICFQRKNIWFDRMNLFIWNQYLDSLNLAKQFYLKGRECQEMDLLDEASVFYMKSKKVQSNYEMAYFGLADILYLKGNYLESALNYEMGLKILKDKSKIQGFDNLNIKFIFIHWVDNIGHISHLAVLVKLKKLGILSPQIRMIVAHPNVANMHYLKYWEKYFSIIYLNENQVTIFSEIYESIFEHLSCIELSDRFQNFYYCACMSEDRWDCDEGSHLLELTKEDTEKGLECLELMGIPNGSWFVGLHVRQNEKRVNRKGSDADIYSYIEAITEITNRGGWVIRMGDPLMTPLPKMDKVFDYALSKYKSEWMDVFIWAYSKFFIGSSSGPLSVPPTFGVPVIYTNTPAIGIALPLPNSFMIPKLYWSIEKKRYLSYSEMLSLPVGWSVSKDIGHLGLEQHDNSPYDIKNAVCDMFHNIEDNSHQKRTELQKQYATISEKAGSLSNLPVSNSFLEKHIDLLI